LSAFAASGVLGLPIGSTMRIDPHATSAIIQADVFELSLPPGALP
jgi:hypothetical protein